MKNKVRFDKPQWWLGGGLILAALIYLSSLSWYRSGGSVLDLRWELLLVLGTATWVLLTVCVMLPARFPWLNRLSGGLDKGYGIHKWLGVAVLSIVFLHWVVVQSWRWMTGWGWLDGGDVMQSVLGRLGDGGAFPLDPLSRLGGGAAFFLMAALVVSALVKRIPYHIFRDIHKMAPVVYLLASIHVLNRIPAEWWATPAAYILAGLTAVGIYASLLSLRQLIGRKRRVKARVKDVIEQAGDIVDVTLEPQLSFPHKSGQFAFIDFTGAKHGSHPFSLASCNPGELRFLIKKLGDATSRLDDILEPGRTVELEGPYGRFDFESPRPRQLWIAGGIGLTPFLSRLEELASQENRHGQIDFWYSVDSEEEAGISANLDALCQRAGVDLHLIVSGRDKRLSAADVAEKAGDLSLCSVWFCGPDGFREDLRRGLLDKGLPERCFHFERFEFR